MTLPQAISGAFVRWCTFGGRAGGSEYWWFELFWTIVFGLAPPRSRGVWTPCALLGRLHAGVPDAVRRRRGPPLARHQPSGWWLLLVFVPLRNIVLLIWFCASSTPGAQPVRRNAGFDLG